MNQASGGLSVELLVECCPRVSGMANSPALAIHFMRSIIYNNYLYCIILCALHRFTNFILAQLSMKSALV